MEKFKNLNGVRLVNLTPHPLTLLNEEGEVVLKLESQGSIRLSSKVKKVGEINGISLTKTVFGGAELPPKTENTWYIVPLVVAQYAKTQGRDDFLIPGEIVRSEDRSTILGMKSLAVL